MARNLVSTCKACRTVIGYKPSSEFRPGYWFHLLGNWMSVRDHQPEPSRLARLRAAAKELFT